MSQPTVGFNLEAFLGLRVFKKPEIKHNYANLKKQTTARLEAMQQSDNVSPITKGLIYLILQKHKPLTKSRLPPQQFVCV